MLLGSARDVNGTRARRPPEASATGAVPEPILRLLRRTIRRARWLIFVRGVCACGATTVLALLAVAGVDAAVMVVSTPGRWALSLSAYAMIAAVTVGSLVRPLARSFSLTGTARLIESHHPELQECLSSAVELLGSRDQPELRGSSQLIAALVTQATHSAADIQPRRELTLSAVRTQVLAAGLVALLLAVLLLIWPEQILFLLARASAPFANLPNLRARDLLILPGDTLLADGDRLQVQLTVAREGVRRASLGRLSRGAAETQEPMTLATGQVQGRSGTHFVYTSPPAATDFRYRVRAGDAVSRYYHVTVTPRPAVERLDLRYEPPEYTRLPPVDELNTGGEIRALAGTSVTLRAALNKPVATASFLINRQPVNGASCERLRTQAGTPECRVVFVLSSETGGEWTLRLTDGRGLTQATEPRPVTVLTDAPPVVRVAQPETTKLRLPPTSAIPVRYLLTDDIGLAGAEFLLTVDGAARPSVPVPLPAEGGVPPGQVQSESVLNLASLQLRGAARMTFQLRVTDVLPAALNGPQVGVSEVYTVELDPGAPSFAEARLLGDQRGLTEELSKAREHLQRAQAQAQQLQQELARSEPRKEEEGKRIDQVRQDLTGAQERAEAAARRTEPGRLEALAPAARDLAQHVAQAKELADQMKLTEKRATQREMAGQTAEAIEQSLKALAELAAAVQPAAEDRQQADKAAELARREAAVAEARLAAEQGAVPQADASAQAQAELDQAQRRIEDETARFLAQVPTAVDRAQKDAAQSASALADQARELAREQSALAQRTQQIGRRLDELGQAEGQLATQQEQLAREAMSRPEAVPQAQPMSEAASDLRRGRLGDAIAEQQAAEMGLRQEQAPAAAPGPDQPRREANANQPDAQGPTPQALGLAQRQAELRQRTEQLLADRERLAAESRQGQIERLRDEQETLARGAEELARHVAENSLPADGLEQSAAAAARQAARELEQDRLYRAAQEAQHAGQGLQRLTERLEAAAMNPARPDLVMAPPQEPGARPAAVPAQEPAQGPGQPAAGQPATAAAAEPQAATRPEAGPAASSAGTATGPAAGRPASPAAADPTQVARDSERLAQRQQEVARELAALAAGDPGEQLSTQQAALATAAAGLAREGEGLRRQAAQLGADAATQEQGRQAAQNLAQAERDSARAAVGLRRQQQGGQGEGGQAAVQAQESAARALTAASQALDGMAKQLGQRPRPGEPGERERALVESSVAAYQAVAEATTSRQALDAVAAAGKLTEMARQAAAAADATKSEPAAEPKAEPSTSASQSGTPVQVTRISETALKALGLSADDWARLPGELRDQVLQASRSPAPAEYRELIRRYYQQLARRGSGRRQE